MTAYDVAVKIGDCIKEIGVLKDQIEKAAILKAETAAAYDRVIAVTILKLRNGGAVEFDGKIVDECPVSVMDKAARGICWKEKLEADKAEALYKALITRIDCTCSQLNGFQSIHRYFDKG